MVTIEAFTFADGAWIFLAIIIAWLVAIVYGYYTRRGSAINQRTYEKADAAGAKTPSVLSHDQSAAGSLIRRRRGGSTSSRKAKARRGA